MASTIRIKRSEVSGNPATLAAGELAYSALPDNGANGGDRLYIGMGTETAGDAANHFVIGGKYFTDKLDHTPGTLTATSAIIVDANSKIDVLNIDNLILDGNTISIDQTSDPNGDINLTPGGAGEINLNAPVNISGVQFTANNATFASANITDLTSGRIVLAGTNGELQDSGNLTFNGTLLTVTGNATVTGTLDVDTNATIASLVVEDLTENGILIAGVGGEVEFDANFTFDGTTFSVGPTGEFTVDVATGNIATDGTLGVTGQSTLASAAVSNLTSGRIVLAGTAGQLEDSADLTFDGTTLTLVGTATIDDISISNNQIVSTGADQDIIISPNGAGTVNVNNTIITGVADPVNGSDAVNLTTLENTANTIQQDLANTFSSVELTVAADQGVADAVNLTNDILVFSGNTGITTTVTDNQIDIDLDDTAVTPGAYGGNSAIPVITIDQQGRITNATTASIATNLNVSGDSGTDVVELANDTLNFTGGVGVTTTVSNNDIEIAIGQDVSTTANVTFNDVTVNGSLFSNDITASTVTIIGDLVVQGNTTSINTEEINLADNVIVLNSNLDGATAPTQDAGLVVNRGSGTDVSFFWDETNDYWTVGTDPNTGGLATLEANIDGGTY